MKLSFFSDEHKDFYRHMMERCKLNDSYHRSFFYVTGIIPEIRDHIGDIYDFWREGIRPEGLTAPWQTESSLRACRLAFNLWNGFGGPNEVEELYLPDAIFCDSLAPYFVEGLRLRFPEYFRLEIREEDSM